MKLSQFIPLSFICVLGIFPIAASAQLTVSGTEVTDSKTGLIWRRCPEGMSLSGSTCTGTPTPFTHEAALQFAATQTGWRLPNIKELSSIVDKNVRIADKNLIYPAIDSTAFPATPAILFWSSSPFVSSPDRAWVIDFSSGVVGGVGGLGRNDPNFPHAVRLVRGGL